MAGLSTQQSLRKALGAIKDSTKVGLAKVNSDYKDLDIAVVKATNHVECPPKEKHVRTIFAATSAVRPRADVAYCIHALARRLAKTHNWTVALKTLIVIHRTLREGDPTFREELLNYSRSRGHVFNMSYFKDDSSPDAWDYSSWIRTYALFLEERLECYRVLKYDLESERALRTKELDTVDLLEHLPALQQLLYRLMGCQPEGAAYSNYVIQYALSLVLKESIKVYHAINDGTINLVDKFFEMQRHDATRALEIYRRAGQQTEKLSEFYDVCKGLDFTRSLKFPSLEQPPLSFLSTMEDYVRDAPRQSSAVRRDFGDNHEVRTLSKVRSLPAPDARPPEVEEPPPPKPVVEAPKPLVEEVVHPPPASENTDFLGLGESKGDPSILEESNALALAIIPSESAPNGTSFHNSNGLDKEAGVTGWELALVTNPSSNGNALNQSKLAGGFDRLTLDSLYDDAMARRSYSMASGGYGINQAGPNPFESAPVMQTAHQDPFFASNKVAPPPNVQMAALTQQHQTMLMQQQMMGGQPVNSYAYGMPYALQMASPLQGQIQNNPFGNPGRM